MISAVIEYQDKTVSIYSSPSVYTGEKFLKGFYECYKHDRGIDITRKEVLENHNPYYQENTETVLRTVKSFFESGIEDKVNELGFTHKLGILLHGRQGTGKTSLMNFIANRLVDEKDAIVFFCNSSNTLDAAVNVAQSIREIQKDPIIFIADEFERFARDNESEIKNLLDGKDSVSNSLFLASTNYIDKVPDTLKDRPSRFKVVKEIKGFTDRKTIFTIVKEVSDRLNPGLFKDEEIEIIVKESKDVTIDEIKHFCLDKLTDNFVEKEERKPIGFNIPKMEDDDEDKSMGLNWVTLSNSKRLYIGGGSGGK